MTYLNNEELPVNPWKIKNLPADNRPDERLEIFGAEALSDAELLAIIIRTGMKGTNSIQLAERILKSAGEKGLTGLCQVSIDELTRVRGVGKVKAVQIKALSELTRRIAKRTAKKRLIFESPESVAWYYMEDLRHKDKECFMVLSLNNKCALIGESMISIGTVNASFASPREIFLEALKHKAVSIILMHNHPSGDPTPSQNDISVTRKVKELGALLEITLVDHIIIGDNIYVSLNEQRLM